MAGAYRGRSRSSVALFLALVSLLAAPLSGCLGGQDQAPGPQVAGGAPAAPQDGAEVVTEPITVITDPAGDAREHNSDSLRYAAPCLTLRDAPSQLDPAQCAGYTAGDAVAGEEPAGGVPAHPARDVLAVRFQETPQVLIVEMDVGSLEPSLEGAIDLENEEGTRYFVDWYDPVTGCLVYVGYDLRPYLDAVTAFPYMITDRGGFCDEEGAAGTEDLSPPCETRASCHWEVPASIVYGSPATIRWDVPRDWMAGARSGDEVVGPWASVWASAPYQGREGSFWTDGPIEARHTIRDQYALDWTGEGASFRFQSAGEPWAVASGPLEVPTRELHVAAEPERPDMRIISARLDPLPDRLRVTYKMERVDEEPQRLDIYSTLALADQSLEIGAYVTPRLEWTTWSRMIIWDGKPDVSIPVDLSIHPGAPGAVVLEVHRSDMLPIPPGATVQRFSTGVGLWNETHHGAAGHTITRVEWTEASMAPAAPRHVLDAAPQTIEGEPSVHVNDPPYDTEVPPDMVASSPLAFDLRGAQVRSPAPGELRFTLSLTDLSDAQVPPGYDAILYAVAVEHERGVDMVGHYRSADQTGGLFFCAPDTTVFATPPAPPPVSWTQIPGRISTSSVGGQTDGGGGTSAVLMFAPADCFGLDQDAAHLNVSALKAGTYVIRRGTALTPATVETLDTLESDGGFLVPFAQPVTEQPSFLSKPFGIENFWDILGLIVAIITVLVTLGIFLRRRRTFHRYLDEIRRIQETYRTDATARATALVEIRYRLNDDLEAHRISDSHYPIVLDRLRARLTSARLTSLGQRFYDVPARISLRIERLLDDGYLAEEEAAVLEPVIREAKMPAESNEELLARLRTWVEEDRSEVVA